jgi:tripartite-type tricarboxylate transporter receptor subunit TctC
MAPKGTPQATVEKLNAAVTEILSEQDVKSRFEILGVQPAPMDSQAAAVFIEGERARWGGIIKSAQIAIE